MKVAIEPDEVVLAGARSSIRQIREVVTEGVDISDLRADLQEQVPLASFGGSLVWRAPEDETPVVVRITIRGPEPEQAPTAPEAGIEGGTSG